jgi:hypothetical protein
MLRNDIELANVVGGRGAMDCEKVNGLRGVAKGDQPR